MSTDIIKKALSLAEKETQEKEIQRIKSIVQSYLERIDMKTKEKKEIEDELRILKTDLDDLKAGRLDRIEERQGKDENARKISLIIVKKVEKEYVPYYPWSSPWIVEVRPCPPYSNGNYYSTAGTITGTTCSNFAKGTYTISGHSVFFS